MKDFNHWKKLHQSEELDLFSVDTVGILWLKIKSIIRKELIAEFIKENKITLKETSLEKQFIELYDLLSKDPAKSHKFLDDYINGKNKTEVAALDTKQLVSELYKLKNFNWGGDYKNSLDKYLVSRYVKVQTPSYETLVSKFETEIAVAVQGYVLNSWYNHWSSILIEHIFKSHASVLPTVGKIKSVDFFINDIPFDLKVTFLPVEYIKSKRSERFEKQAYAAASSFAKKNNIKIDNSGNFIKDLKNFKKTLIADKPNQKNYKAIYKELKELLGNRVELTYLKAMAKKAKIDFDKKATSDTIYYEILEKMKDRNDKFCLGVLGTLKNEKLEILKEVQGNPQMLAKWLYENQGEMRFGSENRLFLVLVDTDDFSSSWKLKRNIDLLKPTILQYLDNFKNKKLSDLKVCFRFKGKPQTFTALADVIFVVK